MFFIRLFVSFFLISLASALCLLPYSPALAAQVSSGTGFFISKSGYILTNAHVVEGCETVMVRGAVLPTQAEVVRRDETIDLALLHSRAIPPRAAYLREMNGLPPRAGDTVMVIGYPGDHGIRGEYKIVHSRIIDTKGPLGDPHHIQFEDAAQQGNSGGPLLDESGNVIGVIVAKTETVRINTTNGRHEVVGRSDIAISLSAVWDFLQGTNIQTRTMTSALQHGNGYLENLARDSLVNIHCRR